jgi:hypothetical protein
VVTDSIQQAVFEGDFSDWRFAFPDMDWFYNLKNDGTLDAHSLTSTPDKPVHCNVAFEQGHSVLAYQLNDSTTAYLPDNNQADIVLKSDVFTVNPTVIKEKNWRSAAMLQAQWMSQTIHPETTDKGWPNLVKGSFISKVMTPVTSYLVVENDAQKAMLKKKQEQVLSGNSALDVGEEPRRMSEPDIFILAVLLMLVIGSRLYIIRRKKVSETE